MSTDYRICSRCFTVEGVEQVSEHCLTTQGPHRWVAAEVTECPFITRTATGRVTARARRQADRDCEAAGDAIHDDHHYGDPERRHFRVPYQRLIDPKDTSRIVESPLAAEIAAGDLPVLRAQDADSLRVIAGWVDRQSKGTLRHADGVLRRVADWIDATFQQPA